MLGHEPAAGLAHRRDVELGEHLAVAVDSLWHADDPFPVYERRWGDQPAVAWRAHRPRDRDQVLESAGGDEANPPPGACRDRIGDRGRAEAEAGDGWQQR